MIIVWDEPKRLANIDKHGFDFSELTTDFFLEARIRQAKNNRFLAVGIFRKIIISVVFFPLGTEGVSVISMRRSSDRERSIYDA